MLPIPAKPFSKDRADDSVTDELYVVPIPNQFYLQVLSGIMFNKSLLYNMCVDFTLCGNLELGRYIGKEGEFQKSVFYSLPYHMFSVRLAILHP